MSQFDTKFTKQTPVDSPDDSVLSESANQVFKVGKKHHSTLSKLIDSSIQLHAIKFRWFVIYI